MSNITPYFIHRSGTETLWTCPRKYMLEYLFKGTGVRRTPTKLQLVIGSAVHVGLAYLCMVLQANPEFATELDLCSEACRQSLEYFQKTDTFQHLKEHERKEQETLIAGLLWSFFCHSWPTFVKTFEVLCVERAHIERFNYEDETMPEFILSSRPDAIVRHRLTNEFIGISWKTIDDLTEYKRWNYRENLQNLMETYYGERILAEVLESEYSFSPEIAGLRGRALIEATQRAIDDFRQLPREIAYVQTIFLVKGTRQCELLDGTLVTWQDGEAYEEQERTWRQQSFLCYRYLNAGQQTTAPDDIEAALEASLKPEALKPGKSKKNPQRAKRINLAADVSWSYRYFKKGNKSYNNLSGDWLRQPLWEASDTTIQEWIQVLNAGQVFPSIGLDDSRNNSRPLDKIVIWDAPVERSAELMVKTMSEVEQAHYEAVRRGFDSKGGLLVQGWQRNLSACHNSAPSAGVPVRCEYLKDGVCYDPSPDGPLIQIGGISEWVKRVPHHEIERQSFEERVLL